MAKKRVHLTLSGPLSRGIIFTLIIWMIEGGCSTEAPEPKPKSKPSADAVATEVKLSALKPGPLSEAQRQHLKLDVDQRLASSKMKWYLEEESDQCRKSSECKRNGLCDQLSLRPSRSVDPVQVKCVALSRQRCLSSRACQYHGMCTPVAGRCSVKSDLDCFQSQRCKFYGLCHVQGERCVAKSDENCQQSQACRDFQTCTHKSGMCVNQDDLSKSCDYGCVKLESGCFCHPAPPAVSTPKGFEPACLSSCRRSGGCSMGESGCSPRNQKDCESSERCRSEGLCDFAQGRCVKSASGCASSLECSLAGRCILSEGRCVASSQEDCLSSRACAEQERCHFEVDQKTSTKPPSPTSLNTIRTTGRCVREAQPLDCRDVCQRLGQCEPLDNACLATSSAQCRRSEVCKKYGLCSARSGRCVAVTTRDCKRSLNCKQLGRCTPKRGRCLQ